MKVINAISRWLGYIGICLIMVLLILIVAHVFMRFALASPITGTPELASLTMACLALGTAWGALKGRHITVDIFAARFPPRVRAIIDSITILASLCIFAIIAWRTFIDALWQMQRKYVASVMMPVPIYPFYLIYSLGLAMFCIAVVTILIQKIKVIKG